MRNNKSFVLITSIFPPTEAVVSLSKMKEIQLIVVGDKKTPSDWHYQGVKFLSVEKQSKLNFHLTSVLPYNHYSRKMIGYLWAIQQEAHYITDTDDDNIPKENYRFPDFSGDFNYLEENQGIVNILQLYTDAPIWPRGLPLKSIKKDFELENKLSLNSCKVGVWQGLADDDPDVDAIYRLTCDEPCFFEKRPPIVLGKGTSAPFNTQNTKFRKELFPLLYIPCHVTFRFTDILRGWVAQPIMWLYDYHLGYTDATVVQKRNPHDYMKDFMSEVPVYQHAEKPIEIVSSAISASKSIEDNLYNAYESLLKNGIVPKEEMTTLTAWLNDIANL